MPEQIWEQHTNFLSTGLLAEFVQWLSNRRWFLWRWTGQSLTQDGLESFIFDDEGRRYSYRPDPFDIRLDRIFRGSIGLRLIWLPKLDIESLDRMCAVKNLAEFIRRKLSKRAAVFWYIDRKILLPYGWITTTPAKGSRYDNSLIVDLCWKGNRFQLHAVSWHGVTTLIPISYNGMGLREPWKKHPQLMLELYKSYEKAIELLPTEIKLAAALRGL